MNAFLFVTGSALAQDIANPDKNCSIEFFPNQAWHSIYSRWNFKITNKLVENLNTSTSTSKMDLKFLEPLMFF